MTKSEIEKFIEHGERIRGVETEIKDMRADLLEVKDSVKSTNDILASMSNQLIKKSDFDELNDRVAKTEKTVERGKIYATIGLAILAGLFNAVIWLGDKIWEYWMKK